MSWTNTLLTIPGDGMDEPTHYMSITIPNEDLIEHDDMEWSCPCLPKYRYIIGVHNVLPGDELCLCEMTEIVHNSLDGRELSE